VRVCIDAQAAVAQRSGIGRYTKLLVQHLAPLRGDDELVAAWLDARGRGGGLGVAGVEERRVRFVPARLLRASWKILRFPPFDAIAGRADLYHFPNFVIPPLARGRAVVTVHDLSFVRCPDTMEEKNRRWLRSQIGRTLARADAVLTDSRTIAAELAAEFPSVAAKVRPVLLGVGEAMRPPEPAAVAAMRHALGLDRPYLLTVGTLEPRKNVPLLVEAFERLGAFDGDLVVAGMRGWKVEPILERMRASPRAQRIRYLEYVDERWLPALYGGAELFLLASLYEGFGLPPLEAMACGTPAVVSPGGSLPEVVGDAATIVRDYDPDAWAGRVSGLLSDGDARAALRARGIARAAAFRWEDTARETWRVYRDAVPVPRTP